MHDKAIPNTLREVNTTLAFVFQISQRQRTKQNCWNEDSHL